jgi:pimeloyl-ACP methyl ester carboxylesterase
MSDRFETGGILPRDNGATIAYNRLAGKRPGIVFLHGFRSDMNGAKALAVEAYCARRGQAFVRFDAFGHGASSGRFEDGTIGRWAEDAVAVLDNLTEGSQILVGSSMGGWLMLLAALARPERIAGLLGLAAAPDFTEAEIWAKMDAAQRQTMTEQGRVVIADCDGAEPLVLSQGLIEEGRRRCLLGGPIPITCPVRLIHGQQDGDVPWQTSLRLAEMLASADIEVTLVKAGGHRLSEPADLARMVTVLEGLTDQVK